MIMTTVRAESGYQIDLPHANHCDEVIALAEQFLRHEATLPASEQSILTPHITHLLAEAHDAVDKIDTAEHNRRERSERLKELDELAMELADTARDHLAFLYRKKPVLAGKWGFKVHQTSRKQYHIKLPRYRRQLVRLLTVYIAQEESRPAAERFTVPDLATMRQVRDDLQSHWQQRDAQRSERIAQVATRNAICAKLSDRLRLALALLVCLRFEDVVSPELAKWGYKLVQRENGRSSTPITPSEEPELDLSLYIPDPDTGVTLEELTAPPESAGTTTPAG